VAELALDDLELMEPAESRRKRYLKVVAVVFLAWSAIGIMNAFQRFANTADMRPDYPLWSLTKLAMISQWIKAVLSLPLLWMVERYPFSRELWKRRVPLYLFALCVYVVIYLLVRPFFVPTIFYDAVSGKLLPAPPFFEAFMTAFRSFFLDLIYGFCLTVLAAYVYQYMKHMKRDQIMRERLQARLASAELHMLKMQLQPHFLFNTLHTISNLATVDGQKAQRMIARLSELLRLSLDHVSSEVVPMRRELEFLESYLEIEKTRFEERLNILMDIDDDVLDAAVPNMLLQPIVENAVRHGISRKAHGGSIMIAAHKQHDRATIVISDDGVATSQKGKSGWGIGINNTRARLHQLYGNDFAFEVRPTELGMVVRIELPFILHPEGAPREEVTA
jgi:sensor histidine kinase YesM